MSILKNPFFLIPSVLFIANWLLEWRGIYLPYYHAYGDDLCCIPVVLGICLLFFRKIVYQNDQFCLSVFHIVQAVIFCSLVFEFLLPQKSAIYTADFLDIVCYAIGGLFFHYFINLPAEHLAT